MILMEKGWGKLGRSSHGDSHWRRREERQSVVKNKWFKSLKVSLVVLEYNNCIHIFVHNFT